MFSLPNLAIFSTISEIFGLVSRGLLFFWHTFSALIFSFLINDRLNLVDFFFSILSTQIYSTYTNYLVELVWEALEIFLSVKFLLKNKLQKITIIFQILLLDSKTLMLKFISRLDVSPSKYQLSSYILDSWDIFEEA